MARTILIKECIDKLTCYNDKSKQQQSMLERVAKEAKRLSKEKKEAKKALQMKEAEKEKIKLQKIEKTAKHDKKEKKSPFMQMWVLAPCFLACR